MRDLHSHILPCVDDGAQSLEESFAMLQAARMAGVTEIVCTPHCRDPYFDYNAMWDAFRTLKPKAMEMGIALHMGFEVNHSKLMELGVEHADLLKFADSDEFLLELSTRATAAHFATYEQTIFQLQGMGYEVIIAHPERYHAIQKDMELARNLVNMGCKLQASADFIEGGRLGIERKPAKRLFKENLITYIASDAHNPHHYELLAQANSQYKKRGKHTH